MVATFAFVHGGGSSGWDWHLVEERLRARGYETVAPDLPDDEASDLDDCAATVIEAVGDRTGVIMVAHSWGGFTATLAAERLGAKALVFVAGMVPAPGESPADWWGNVGYEAAAKAQAAHDGGLTGNDDEDVTYYHDVPKDLAEEAKRRVRSHPSTRAYNQPFPLAALPEVPTRFVLCTEDRFFPAALLRRIARERLGLAADEIFSGHYVALSHPDELASLLDAYARAV